LEELLTLSVHGDGVGGVKKFFLVNTTGT